MKEPAKMSLLIKLFKGLYPVYTLFVTVVFVVFSSKSIRGGAVLLDDVYVILSVEVFVVVDEFAVITLPVKILFESSDIKLIELFADELEVLLERVVLSTFT